MFVHHGCQDFVSYISCIVSIDPVIGVHPSRNIPQALVVRERISWLQKLQKFTRVPNLAVHWLAFNHFQGLPPKWLVEGYNRCYLHMIYLTYGYFKNLFEICSPPSATKGSKKPGLDRVKALDQVDRYTYLGQLISIHRDWEPEVKRRVALGWQAFGRLNNVWASKLPLCLKRKLTLTGIGWIELPIERTGDLDGRPLLSSGPIRADDDDVTLPTERNRDLDGRPLLSSGPPHAVLLSRRLHGTLGTPWQNKVGQMHVSGSTGVFFDIFPSTIVDGRLSPAATRYSQSRLFRDSIDSSLCDIGSSRVCYSLEIMLHSNEPMKSQNKDQVDHFHFFRDTPTTNDLNSGTTIDATGCFLTAVNCASTTYRAANGTCNNIQDPYLGSIFTPFDRILPAQYGANNTLRTGPNPRTISRAFHKHSQVESNKLTLLAMQFGQFLDHDITHTPTTTVFDDNSEVVEINCCDSSQAALEPDCAGINVEGNDDAFTDVRCARQQMNQITTFIDASNVYGSSDAHMDELRAKNGLLKVTSLPQSAPSQYLPEDSHNQCGANKCFLAGDDRANEQTDLTVIHTIFMREHNKIAEKVKAARPSWNGDRIFLETRKIMAAIFQNIVYQEYLPAILGKKYVAGDPNLNLNVHQNYDSNTRPVIFNEFATAAFRFGHSQLRDLLPRQGKASVKLSSVYFNPFILYESGNPVQEMTAGMLNEVSMKTDRFFTQQVTDNLFPSPGVKFDLIALNIQRGRDHGLPPYKSYKENFGGTVNGDIGRATYKALLRAYGNNADAIDLFVGGIAEKKQGGGAVGPLFRKILADQFTRLRLGDRFFFENGLHYSAGFQPPPQQSWLYLQLRKSSYPMTVDVATYGKRFTNHRPPTFQNIQFQTWSWSLPYFEALGVPRKLEAIKEIKKVRLSHILCRSADISGTIGEFALLKDNTNTVNCGSSTIQSGINVSFLPDELVEQLLLEFESMTKCRPKLKGKGQLTGLTRNNYCRFPFLCELTADEAYRQIDEKNFILSFGVDDKTADDMKSGKIINTTECFLTELQCSDIDNNFRTSNGTCNNVKDPYLGSIFTPFDRILEAEFSGTNDSLRVGPNPRTISRVYNQHVPKKDGRLNLMAMQFGQFLDHDITSTPMTTVFDENKEVIEVNCCDPAQAILVPDCAIITVEGTDDAFTDIRCMNFIRSTPISNVLSGSCKVGPRQQMNQVTSFIDASQVYGSSDELMKELRLENGFLNVTFLPQSVPREYLPQDGSQCGNNPCFRAGDDRVNEQLDLTVMHTIFMREHNLIAAKITEAQPSWSGDKVFLEARKIMAAIMQNIVYQEYLPATLGQTFIDFNNTLNLKVPQDYNPSVRPVIFNEFATAAFRFGHSQLPDQLPRFRHPSINLSSVFFDPFVLYEPGDPVYEVILLSNSI
ncbi:Peroxidasin [Nymphon striatum]|nr:Peroxidasin [Nymphon striatum]